MLPSPAGGGDVDRLLDDTGWYASPKVDGDRVLVVCGPEPQFLNRRGDPYTKRRPADLAEVVAVLPAGLVLDGELVDDRLYLFDCVVHGEPIGRRLELCERVVYQTGVLAGLDRPVILGVPHVTDPTEKRALYDTVFADGGEGVVFKRIASLYFEGRTELWRKTKFTFTVDCLVIGRQVDRKHGAKENLALGLLRDGELVEVAHCSALTGDGPLVEVGDVVTVTALKVTDGNRLREPVRPILRRGEVEPAECRWEQLEAARRG
jgi:ATP-dependent DNA ligase